MAAPTGRNDPCPCGSGRKYKKCCINRKEETVQVVDDSPQTLDDIRRIIDTELEWADEQYRLVAHHFLNKLDPAYTIELENIHNNIFFWNDFANMTLPTIQKIEALSAALEYFTAKDAYLHVTQSEVAKRYGVSIPTVSKWYREMDDFMEERLNHLHEGDWNDEWDELSPSGSAASSSVEGIMREMQELIGGHRFETQAEAEAFVHAFMQSKMNGTPLPAAPGGTEPAAPGGSKREAPAATAVHANRGRRQAREILSSAMDETSSFKRTNLAKKALKQYPYSPDAYLILAEEERTPEGAMKLLKQGIEAGERDLGEPFFRENEGYFWGLTETRPYMRVKYNYADLCWNHGDIAEAQRQLEHILRLNPGDNMGARYLLLAVYLHEDQLEHAERLLDKYGDEAGAAFLYDRLVLEYKKNGTASAKLKMAYRSALNANPHVPKFLTGERNIPDTMPEYYGIGDENEAIEYVASHAKLWIKLPKLIRWMSKQS